MATLKLTVTLIDDRNKKHQQEHTWYIAQLRAGPNPRQAIAAYVKFMVNVVLDASGINFSI